MTCTVTSARQIWTQVSPTPLDREFYGRVRPRHTSIVNVLFVGSHVKAVKVDALDDPNIWCIKKFVP